MLEAMKAPIPAPRVGAPGVVILGAGASARMGRPKLLLPWRGTTVIGRLISQWRELNAAQIAIVLRPGDVALAAELDRLNVPTQDRIENSRPERGMFSSIICSANWAGWREEISHWAIVLGDQPHLQTETLQALLECSTREPEAVCQPALGGHAGHPVILPWNAFTALKNPPAETLKDFLKLMAFRSVQYPVTDGGLLLDLDTPEDYKRLTTFQ